MDPLIRGGGEEGESDDPSPLEARQSDRISGRVSDSIPQTLLGVGAAGESDDPSPLEARRLVGYLGVSDSIPVRFPIYFRYDV